MKHAVIENSIINSPFAEPKRHFRFSDEGVTDEIVPARRVSSYFIPSARPKKQDADFPAPRTVRVPAVNQAGNFGRSAFAEIADIGSVSGIMGTAITSTEAAP